jgi:hypothetical protein
MLRVVYAVVLVIVFCVVVWAVLQGVLTFWQSFTHQIQESAAPPLGVIYRADAAVVPNGGKVLQPKHPIGPHGFRAVILDSEGNRVALHSR